MSHERKFLMANESEAPPFVVPKRIPALGWTVNRAHPESGRFSRAIFITYAVGGAIAAGVAAALWLSR
jgi:hypothetical protein